MEMGSDAERQAEQPGGCWCPAPGAGRTTPLRAKMGSTGCKEVGFRHTRFEVPQNLLGQKSIHLGANHRREVWAGITVFHKTLFLVP